MLMMLMIIGMGIDVRQAQTKTLHHIKLFHKYAYQKTYTIRIEIQHAVGIIMLSSATY